MLFLEVSKSASGINGVGDRNSGTIQFRLVWVPRDYMYSDTPCMEHPPQTDHV